jgi:hypothetical protein
VVGNFQPHNAPSRQNIGENPMRTITKTLSMLAILLSLAACDGMLSIITKSPTEENIVNITIGDTLLTATLVDNSSVDALKEALMTGPIVINMSDYGNMEKVGSLGMTLPRNDQQITTQAGDIILYQGGALVIYYAPNSWNFTRLGRIDNVTAEELRAILGDGNITITLSLP